MRTRRTLTGLIALSVLGMALAARPALAQDPTGRASAAPLAPMGTAFTYQGQLIKNGSPVTGTCDFMFTPYDAQTDGSPLAGYEDILNVTVTGGLFTVPNLDFGSGVFTGAARWLEVLVRCPAGSGEYAMVGSRQELTPTPYALHAGRATLASTALWGGLIGVPAGFADNVDNNTTYTTDWTLTMTGTELGIRAVYQLPQWCVDGDIAAWNDDGEVWVCTQDQDTGDITSVVAGAGLTGGGLSGEVTIDAQFGGTGTSAYIARSDHDHWGAVWTGAGTGLNLSGGTTGIHVDGSAADLDLGGDPGTIVADDTVGANIELYSNDEVEVHLDADNNSGTSSFTVYSGAGANVFSVDEEGEMTWGSWAPRTGYISIPSPAFHPQYSGTAFTDLGFYLYPRDAQGGVFRAPVYLPHGAVVTQMTWHWSDSDSAKDATCTLYRVDFPGITEFAMATVSTSGSAGSSESGTDTTIDYATVNNSENIYYVTLTFPSSYFVHYAAVIKYTYTGPH